jgi:hypothetical protein
METSAGWERTKRVVDLVAGLSVIATMVFIALQWNEMHTGAGDTHDLAVAAKSQADAAKSQADNTRNIAEAAKSQADNTRDLALAAKSAAKTADVTLRSAQEQFRVEHRPYLSANPQGCINVKDPAGGPAQNVLTQPTEDGGILICVTVPIINNGRSPAVDVLATQTLYKLGPKTAIRQEVEHFVPKYDDCCGRSIVNTALGITPISDIQPVTKDQLAHINDGSWEIYVVGAVRYRDMFLPQIKPYETTYCWQLGQVGLVFRNCNFPRPAFGNSIK